MLLVLALGGHALSVGSDRDDVATVEERLAGVVDTIAWLAEEHDIVITHGNGPQVGRLAALHASEPRPTPLDVIGAESDGRLGYLVQRSLANALARRGSPRDVATLLTEVVVDRRDPAFAHPTKPIGPPSTDPLEVERWRARGWSVRALTDPDGRTRHQRVVASPNPLDVIQIHAIRTLLAGGTIVVAAGGGGIPVVVDDHGQRAGVEAVVDKDATSSRLGIALAADRLVLLTDVDGVHRDHGGRRAERLDHIDDETATLLDLDPGSMGPKVAAALAFHAATGAVASIGHVAELPAVLQGTAGTHTAGWLSACAPTSDAG